MENNKSREAETLKVLVTGTKDGVGDGVHKDVFLAIIVSSRMSPDGSGTETSCAVLRPGVNPHQAEANGENWDEDKTIQWTARHMSAHVGLVQAMYDYLHGKDAFLTQAELLRKSGKLAGAVTGETTHPPTREDWDRLSEGEGHGG